MPVQNSPKKSKLVLPKWPIISLFILFWWGSTLPPIIISLLSGYFLFLTLIVWVSRRKALPKSLSIVFVCFILMIVVGAISGIGNERVNYLKDGWYYSNPAVCIFVGYTMGVISPSLKSAIRMFLYASMIFAVSRILTFIQQPELLTMSAVKIRELVGGGKIEVAITCALLLCKDACATNLREWFKTLEMSPIIAWAVLLFAALAVLLAFSRTILLGFLVMFFAMKGYMSGKRFIKFSTITIIVMALFLGVTTLLPEPTREEKQTVIGKLLRSGKELTIENYSDMNNISENFRGFETARSWMTFKEGGYVRWFIGHGFGYVVDLGIYITLGEEPQRYITIMHNGMLYLLVKSGIIGLSLFLVSFVWMFFLGYKFSDAEDDEKRLAARIVQGLVAVSLLTTWVVAGPFNKTLLIPSMFFLGFCMSILEKPERQRGRA